MSLKTIENMVEWVESNIHEAPSLNRMSKHVGYSPCYCSSKFHEIVGCSFKEYVGRRKLSSAALDLLNTRERIIDIAIKYGYSSHEAFTRSFSKEYGISPSRFRKQKDEVTLFKKHVFRHTIKHSQNN